MGPDTDGSADRSGSQDSVVALARAKVEALDLRQEELAETRSRLERLIDICGDPSSDDCQALRVTD